MYFPFSCFHSIGALQVLQLVKLEHPQHRRIGYASHISNVQTYACAFSFPVNNGFPHQAYQYRQSILGDKNCHRDYLLRPESP